MLGDKFFSLIERFSKQERNRFGRFLESPYHNDDERALRLWQFLKNRNLETPPDKRQMWRSAYPEKPLDEAALRRLLSDLLRLGLHFLAIERRREIDDLLLLQPVLGQKNRESIEQKIERIIESEGISVEYFWRSYMYRLQTFNRASRTVSTADYLVKLQSAERMLDAHYAIQKLRFYVSALAFRGFRSAESEYELPAYTWDMLQAEPIRSLPLIGIYLEFAYCLRHPEAEERFARLLHVLASDSGHIAPGELRECYLVAQNYCAFKINQGKTEYYRTVFEIFRILIDRHILLEDGRLSEGMYKNIITSGLRVNEYAWVESFIVGYSEFLPDQIRENARLFNLANLYSHQKMHDKVIELLQNVAYSDLVYALGAKMILLRTYYESREYIALDSLLDSVRIYVNRNQQLSRQTKREYLGFYLFKKN